MGTTNRPKSIGKITNTLVFNTPTYAMPKTKTTAAAADITRLTRGPKMSPGAVLNTPRAMMVRTKSQLTVTASSCEILQS